MNLAVPPGTATVSGKIVTPLGDGLGGVTVNLSGTTNGTTTTAPDGSYSFTGITPGTYTVTPVVPAANLPAGGDEFTPTECDNGAEAAGSCSNMTLSSTTGDIANFTAAYTLNGTVKGIDGQGVQGATVVFVDTVQGSGAVEHTTATTNSQGQIVASASASSPGVQLAPGRVVASVDPLDGTPFFAVPGSGVDPDCVPSSNGDWCDVNLDHDRSNVDFSACVVPNPDGAPLPAPFNTSSDPIPGAIQKQNLEAVGCWTDQGDGNKFVSTQPVRLDGIDLVPSGLGTRFVLDKDAATVSVEGAAKLQVAGYAIWPLGVGGATFDFKGSSVAATDLGAAESYLGFAGPRLLGMPLKLSTGGGLGSLLPLWTLSPGQTSITFNPVLPTWNTAVSWNPLEAKYFDPFGTVPNWGPQLTLRRPTGRGCSSRTAA